MKHLLNVLVNMLLNTKQSENYKRLRNSTAAVMLYKSFWVFTQHRTITDWNKLPAEALGTSICKPHIFRRRVRKVIKSEVK
jgi:hypothetical protein